MIRGKRKKNQRAVKATPLGVALKGERGRVGYQEFSRPTWPADFYFYFYFYFFGCGRGQLYSQGMLVVTEETLGPRKYSAGEGMSTFECSTIVNILVITHSTRY